MSDERLILPIKPQRHRHRFLAVMTGAVAVVAVIWGFQMKTTFKKFATVRSQQADQLATESDSQAKLNAAAKALQAQISIWQNELKQQSDAQAAKAVLLDKVAETMNANLEAQATAATPQPTVAGENTEVAP